MSDIRFGTDGWRAIIADEFTFDGVRLASRAIAASTCARGPLVAIHATFICGSAEIFESPLSVKVSTFWFAAKLGRLAPSWA